MVDSAIGPVPQGWEVKTLHQLADEIRDPADPRAIDPDTPYVGLEHIPRRSTTFGDWGMRGQVGSLKLKFKPGDILFGKIRPYFHKCAVAPVQGVASSDAIIIRPKQSVRAVVASLTSSDAFVAHAVKTSNGARCRERTGKFFANTHRRSLRRFGSAVRTDSLANDRVGGQSRCAKPKPPYPTRSSPAQAHLRRDRRQPIRRSPAGGGGMRVLRRPAPSLRAERSNPGPPRPPYDLWIASSLTLLAMTAGTGRGLGRHDPRPWRCRRPRL